MSKTIQPCLPPTCMPKHAV